MLDVSLPYRDGRTRDTGSATSPQLGTAHRPRPGPLGSVGQEGDVEKFGERLLDHGNNRSPFEDGVILRSLK